MGKTTNHGCVYANCTNNNTKNKDVSFFKFPLKDRLRTRDWQKNCGNLEIATMEIDNLKQKKICEKHFLKEHIYVNHQRKMLIRDAVPQRFISQETCKQGSLPSQTKTFGNKRLCVSSSTDEDDDDNVKIVLPKNAEPCNKGKVVLDDIFVKPREATRWNARSPCPSVSSVVSNESRISDRILEMESPTKFLLQKQCTNLTYKVKSLRLKVLAQKARVRRLKSKTNYFTNALTYNLRNKSFSVKTFVAMQLITKKKINWTKEQKDFALSLYYKSPGAYKFLLRKHGFFLPAVRTIQRWLKITSLRTGVNKTSLIKKLSAKAKTMEENEKTCVVMFDEFAIKPRLEYNESEDMIEGYEDLGTLGRNSQIANHCLVFLIRGLLFNWRIPLCYFVSAGPVKGSVLKTMIETVISALKRMSFKPIALVCDQGSNNRKAFNLLGATTKNPTAQICGETIFTIFDVPHLLKSLRNNFMNRKLTFSVNGSPISSQDVRDTYDVDKKSLTTRAMTKITNIHIDPNTFQKMKVRYAAQLFSHSVSAAILTCVHTNQLTSATALKTAEFIEFVNNLFDCLNSRTLKDKNPYKRPLSVFNDKQEELLKKGLKFFQDIEVTEKETKEEQEKRKKKEEDKKNKGKENIGKKGKNARNEKDEKIRHNIYCVDGFQWTIQSVLMLWTILKSPSSGVKYLVTSFLNQDPIENFFSVIRNRGGYNPMPSVRQARIAIQHNMNIRLLMTEENGNCEEDPDGEVLGLLDNEDELEEENQKKNSPELQRDEIEFSSKENIPPAPPDTDMEEIHHVSLENNLETCTTVYVAGYLLHKLKKKFNCNVCLTNFSKSNDDLVDKHELFLLCKEYQSDKEICSLKRPSDNFSKLIVHLLHIFVEIFNKHKLETNLSSTIFNKLKIVTLSPEYVWFHEPSECVGHKNYILSLLIKLKIYSQLKWETEKLNRTNTTKNSSQSSKPHRKVRILSKV